jgi:hypothetical protein
MSYFYWIILILIEEYDSNNIMLFLIRTNLIGQNSFVFYKYANLYLYTMYIHLYMDINKIKKLVLSL